MPVKVLNKQVYYEHGGNPFKGLHRWYSRKPLSFSRASVLGSLLPDTISNDEFLYLLAACSKDVFDYLKRSDLSKEEKEEKLQNLAKLYKTPPTKTVIKKVRDYCEKVWGTRTPVVLDAFAGGGSIPFEAARYGFRVFASDLNPVAVVTMKAAMEFPLKFGPDLQQDIDRWVKWVGDEAERRLAQFFPSLPGETVQNYLWAHTVTCPSCSSVVPLSPNWWLYKRPEKQNLHKWCAVKPIPNLEQKRVDFELVKGSKGKGTTIKTDAGEFDPKDYNTISRGVGKCPNCGGVIEDDVIKSQAVSPGFGHQLYAVAYRKGKGGLEFRVPTETDLEAVAEAENYFNSGLEGFRLSGVLPDVPITHGEKSSDLIRYGMNQWADLFNPRQLLTLVTYVEAIDEAKALLRTEYEPERAAAVATYLALVLDRCVDKNSRLGHWHSSRATPEIASAQHALNLNWNYPEVSGCGELWHICADAFTSDYTKLCQLLNAKPLPLALDLHEEKTIQINLASADSLHHISDNSIHAIVTDPPYYGTIQYAELSDFFYVWQKRTLGDIFPDLFWSELSDKDREAVANPSRFRNMGVSPEELANQDYEAKMALVFGEYHRVLRDDGIMTVQFNHKESGAWDVLAKSLIDAGFQITASWAVSTENPQNLHQAQKNSVASTVLLVCRKRAADAEQAWWEELRPEVANVVERRAPEFENNDITGIDLYLSAFGPALNVFSRAYPILDSSGEEMRPEVAFAEARKAIANYRFRKLTENRDINLDSLTQWYLLAWDAFGAREFPYDDARQLALAIGGFDVSDLVKTHKLIDSTSGTCKLLTPQQRLKKRGLSLKPEEFSRKYLVDALHGIIAIWEEEKNQLPVRKFMEKHELLNDSNFMRTIEVALKTIPFIKDSKKRISEEESLRNLWLGIDEIKDNVSTQGIQGEIEF